MAAVSTTAAVGWLVSPIVRRMVSVVQSYMSSQYSWKSEMVPDLKRIEALLMEILLVVGAAERQQTMDRNQIVLLQKLKEAVCDAENILDKFEYMLLKEKIEQQDMVTCIASSSLSFGMRLIGLDKFRSKLQKVIETMTRVRACADMLVRVMTVERNNSILSLECVHSRATGSLLYEDVVFGRQKEIDELVNQLGNQFHECSLSDGQRFRTEVHTIVGVGGVGKTTLTQLIYNDERIADNFDLRMWVCVSNTFDKFRLIKDMIACTTVDQNIQLDNFSFSMLQKELERAVHGKRFLLVLDDVWYDEKYGEHINKERWMELLAPIKSTVYGNRRGLKRRTVGSKILVTTRTELVANMLDSRSLFLLDGLGHDDSWLLFRRCAFGNMNPEDYPDLKRTGIQIVQKLKGSALALKVIGGHLNGKYTESEWDNVLHKDLVNPNDILTILRLSYDSLPEHLQQCFAYCSLFPKAYRFDPNRLIRMWVAHGFVHLVGTNSSSLEDTGRRYFNDLLARSFFQVLQCGDHRYFIMHDSMNDLALHVSQGECFRADHDREIVLPHSVSHLSISAEQLGNIANSDNLRRLRTLIVLSKSWFCSKVCLNHDILKKLKGVRVLDLTGCCFETFPEAVNSLIHLRFVAIRRTHFPHHSALSRLYHLQALFVQYHSCYSSGITSSTKRKRIDYPRGKVNTIGGYFSLPESISKLRNLVHVNVEKAYTLMLSGMHPFPYVEGSGEFLVDKEEQSLVKLKDLNKISGELAIRLLEHIRNWEEAAKANLNQKEHITKLELEWGLCDGVSIENGFKVLDVLKPQCNLDELTITGYPGFRSPSWLESGYLRRLKFVCLRDCNRWEVLPPLGDLPLLRTLEVRRMGELKTAGPEFFGCSGFPSLEKLLLERLPKLRWSVVENDQVFPNLRHLSVAGCPQLREYPTYPRTLRHIAILDKERIQVKTYIDSFDLSRSFCRLVSSSFHVLRAHHLEFVRNLEIYVNYLVSMSNMAFNNMRSLKKLKIYGIDRSKTFSVICTLWDENGHTVLPSSLRCLKLQRCYMQPYSFSKLLNNLSSLDTLHLTECDTVEMPCPPLNLSHLRMLKQLHIYKCDWITFFKCSEALVTLEEMKIDQCYDLEYIPDVNDMPSLQKLHLKHCPQVMRLSNVGYQTTLKELVIEFCDGLLSLGQLRGLVSLTELRVIRCSDLVLLPDMDAFYSLEILVIKYCPLLRSLPKSGLPVSLKTFVLDGCHQALEEQFQQKEGSDWNKVAALPGCMRRTNESTQKHGPSYSGMEWEMWDEF